MSKKYRAKLRLKRKRKIYKNVLLIFILLIILSFSPYLYSNAFIYIKKIYSYWNYKNINNVKVDFKENFIALPITDFLKKKIGSEFTEMVKDEIKNYLYNKWPYISQLEIKYNRITGGLYVSGSTEKPVALCYTDSDKRYLLESGRIINGVNFGDNFIKLKIDNKIRCFSQPVVEFIKNFNNYATEAIFTIKEMIYDDNENFYIILDDGSKIVWGNLDFTREKILKLNIILKDAREKIPPPFKVDMRYFKNGKIFISTLN